MLTLADHSYVKAIGRPVRESKANTEISLFFFFFSCLYVAMIMILISDLEQFADT